MTALLTYCVSFHPENNFIYLNKYCRLVRLSFGFACAHFAQCTQRSALASGTAQLNAQEMTIIVVFVKCYLVG
jgi:hypothetical protein